MIILQNGKFISGLRIYRAGEILPDTASAKFLVEKGLAEIVAETPKKSAKITKKSETEKVETVRENAENNT